MRLTNTIYLACALTIGAQALVAQPPRVKEAWKMSKRGEADEAWNISKRDEADEAWNISKRDEADEA
ncbi:hypothetical protein BDW74DRAFT_174048, partial [Aspergillus multicolor]|uniref:uncharacterized protein n=1 Tax=Aspergillus multicolor TaxID=41759 RepID=UPI003CCCA8DA